LAQWQDACNCERNGSDGDPLLANASANDFYLQSRSPCANAGFGSQDECITACDIGALESLH